MVTQVCIKDTHKDLPGYNVLIPHLNSEPTEVCIKRVHGVCKALELVGRLCCRSSISLSPAVSQ